MEIQGILPGSTLNGPLAPSKANLDPVPSSSNDVQSEPKSKASSGLKIAGSLFRLVSAVVITVCSPENCVAVIGLMMVEPKKLFNVIFK